MKRSITWVEIDYCIFRLLLGSKLALAAKDTGEVNQEEQVLLPQLDGGESIGLKEPALFYSFNRVDGNWRRRRSPTWYGNGIPPNETLISSLHNVC